MSTVSTEYDLVEEENEDTKWIWKGIAESDPGGN